MNSFNDIKSPTILIIGAGAAGIAVANRLVKKSFTNFLILEAENRIGGRIYSTKFGKNMVDLGAQWCHGETNNIVYEMMKKYKVLKHHTSKFEHSNLIYSNLISGIDQSFKEKLSEIFWQIYRESYQTKTETSVGEYFDKTYTQTVQSLFVDDNQRRFSLDAKHFFLHLIASLEGTLSVSDVTTNNNYEECEGDQMLNWDGKGFHTILDVLMNKFPNPEDSLHIEDKILLGKEVKAITWNNNDGKLLKIECTDGSSFRADYVVVTVSMGVLKDRINNFFIPELPETKQLAIKDIGFGAIAKIFLLFSEKWWPDDVDEFGFVWEENDRQDLENSVNDWIMNIFYMFILKSNPNVLCFFLSHNNVPHIELKADDEIIEGVMFTLNKFFGNTYRITQPINLLRTKWYCNPHFKGSYSYESINSVRNDRLIQLELAEPVISPKTQKPVILFAGEATHPKYYGTVHGAIETGFREADKLLNLIKPTRSHL